ncbi:MAG: neutral/alkaline non-lysosomal ceramidase N-terminal domain-containing protein [Myxococcota bacterium]
MFRFPWLPFTLAALLLATGGCDDDPNVTPEDGGTDTDADAGPPGPTDHCDYAPTDPTAGAGGTVEAGSLEAAAVEAPIDLPVGSTLGAYGDRAVALSTGTPVDSRTSELAGIPDETAQYASSFAPSVGVETFPMAKVLALRAGEEQVLLVTLDLGVGFESLTWDVSEALGPDFHGKVLIANSHSHGAYGHYTHDFAMQVAFGPYRNHSYQRLLDQVVSLSEQAMDALEPARIGFAHDDDFDPDDLVNRDRRGENDELLGGRRDDHDLFVVRVDTEPGGDTIAVLPVIGLHGTILGGRNLLATTDAPGAVARGLEEAFDDRVVVMHLQGAAGDVSPAGTGGLDCSGLDRCYSFARVETIARYARDMIMPVYEQAGMAMQTELAMEVLTRSIPLGPDDENFVVRDGELRYGAWDGTTTPDGEIYGPGGEVLSPLDEFNAPTGAALCAEGSVPLPLSPLPSEPGIPLPPPYDTCLAVTDMAAEILAGIFDFNEQQTPLCYSTRTTIAAMRLGDYVLAGAPGETVTLWTDTLRAASPVDPDKTIVVGYANDNIGYLLTPEDWLAGGYEPSINMWGPLEGQYILERLAELMQMAVTPEREDATEGTDTRMTVPPMGRDEPLPPPDPAPDAGTVPDTIPETLFVRLSQQDMAPTTAQPAAQVKRLESVHFVWIGEDPMRGTPDVNLQYRASDQDPWETVTRRSGRPVRDQDVILTWTPDPLQREGTDPRTHYWAAEWQAVTPFGTPGMDDLASRPGVALGEYRFRVRGAADDGPYEITSNPFEVVPGDLAVSATVDQAEDELVMTVHYHAPHGWRLLSLDGASNQPVPVVPGATVQVDVTVSGGTGPAPGDHSVGSEGEVRIPLGTGTPTSVEVEDFFGNTGSATVD